MATLSVSDLLGVLPGLRAFAVCLVGDQGIADALVEMVLLRAWKGDHRIAEDDPITLLYTLMHREFEGNESTRAVDPLNDRPTTHFMQDRGLGSTYVRSLLGRLPPDEREAILLVEACKFSEVKAATICECDLWTIRRRVASALEQLSGTLLLV